MMDIKFKVSILNIINALGILIYLFNLVITPFEFTFGTFSFGIFWFILLLLPAIVPILFNSKAWKYFAFILGIICTLFNLVIGLGYILDNQMQIGLMLIFYWSIFGVLAIVFCFKWIKQPARADLQSGRNNFKKALISAA